LNVLALVLRQLALRHKKIAGAQKLIKRIASMITSALLATCLAGCAALAKKPLADPRLQGRLEGNVYTSPRESFRVRIPWLSTNATLRDETSAGGAVLVTIADDLCREFTISQRPGFLGTQSFESWVEAHIVEDLKRLKLDVQSKTRVTKNGLAVSLRYRAPAAAPCDKTVDADGKKVVTKLDADVGWYVYHRDGVFYRLIYVVGVGPEAPTVWYVNREPVDDVLARFADGFEIMASQKD
jgi:hypothetical protein